MNMKTTGKTTGWIFLVIALIAVNLIAAQFHYRADLTQEKRYSLTKPTRQLLSGLEEEVRVDVLMAGEDLPAVVRKFRNALNEFLHEAKEYGGTRFQFRFMNPYDEVNDTTQVRVLEDSIYARYGLYPMVLNAPGKVGDNLEIKKLIHGAIIHYKDRSVGVDFLKGVPSYGTEAEQLAALYNQVEASLEYNIASNLQKITTDQKPSVGYALGNGEAWGYNVDDAVRTMIQNYNFDTINLRQASYIPSELDALVVLKPTESFADAEKLKIDQYVMNGGKVFWLIDNMFAEFDSLYKTQGFVAFDRNLNLEDLLFNYGVRLNQTLLQDMQSDKLPQVSTAGDQQQQRLVDWPFFPILNGTDHPISKNLDGVRSMFPTTIDTVEAANVQKTFLLRSSNNTRLLNAPAKIDFEFLQIAPDAQLFREKNVPVAVLLEGNFRSLYTGRIPKAYADAMQAAGRPVKTTSGELNKMIVVADGDIATNPYSQFSGPLPMGSNVFTRYTYANKDFFLNSLEYLVNPSDILQARAKEYSLRLLDPQKVNEERSLWQFITVGLPILVIILFGLIYQRIRKHKYVTI